MANREFEGKKLLILGGNPETVPLVEMANGMGIKTIVASSVPDEPAKRVAWMGSDVDGMDVPGLVALAREQKVDGVEVALGHESSGRRDRLRSNHGTVVFAGQKYR